MNYEELMAQVAEHMNEWHTTDEDGVRRCDYVTGCLLDQTQGYVPDDGMPEYWKAAS